MSLISPSMIKTSTPVENFCKSLSEPNCRTCAGSKFSNTPEYKRFAVSSIPLESKRECKKDYERVETARRGGVQDSRDYSSPEGGYASGGLKEDHSGIFKVC